MAATSRAGTGLVGLLKQGWNEIPEVLGSGVMALIGLGMGAWASYHYVTVSKYNRQYRKIYTVVRDDDPMAPKYRAWELKNLEKMQKN